MNDLKGKVILLTRTAADCESWVKTIQDRGGLALNLPCLTTEEITEVSTRSRLATSLESADWLLFTSRRGVCAVVLFSEILHQRGAFQCALSPRPVSRVVFPVR